MCLRLEVNRERGTCWGEGGMQASFAPNQMARMRIRGAVGVGVISCDSVIELPFFVGWG